MYHIMCQQDMKNHRVIKPNKRFSKNSSYFLSIERVWLIKKILMCHEQLFTTKTFLNINLVLQTFMDCNKIKDFYYVFHNGHHKFVDIIHN